MTLVRDASDYDEIVLVISGGALLPVVIESALRLAINEGSVVRFTFNETEIIIDPIKIRDHIVNMYNTRQEV